MHAHDRILIAGGGIGGLSAALALARVGRGVLVLERRSAFSEAGAGIQLGPNGVRLLQRLGVAERLAPLAVAPERIDVFSGQSGKRLTSLPLGAWMVRRFGAPYWIAHRRDLHDALAETVRAEPRIAVRMGFSVEGVATEGAIVTAESVEGERVSGAALIGADGLRSRVAACALGAPAPRPAGKSAFRALLDIEQVDGPFAARDAVGLWLGEGAHLVTYPVRAGRLVNVVAVLDDEWTGEGWNSPDDGTLVRSRFAGWAPVVRAFLDGVSRWRKWSLVARPALPRWVQGRVALLGDAAHPIFPFLAQGGVLAIEDAVALADALAGGAAGDVTGALLRYERARMGRAARVVAESRKNGRLYHLTGAMRRARDAALKAMPPAWLMRRYDWLYGYGRGGAGSGAGARQKEPRRAGG